MTEEPVTIAPPTTEITPIKPADLTNFGQPEKTVRSEPEYIQERFAHLDAIYRLDFEAIDRQQEQHPEFRSKRWQLALETYQLLVIKNRLEENPEDGQARSQQAFAKIKHWALGQRSRLPEFIAIELLGHYPQQGKKILRRIALGNSESDIARQSAALKTWASLDPEFGPKNKDLQKLLSRRKDPRIRAQALAILAKSSPPKALKRMTKFCRSKDPLLRREASATIGALGQDAWPLLEKLTKDKHPSVAQGAFNTMAQLGERG
ncbi:HEAT repeat domain-containing protein, partial [Patescibacteria group bacterium]